MALALPYLLLLLLLHASLSVSAQPIQHEINQINVKISHLGDFQSTFYFILSTSLSVLYLLLLCVSVAILCFFLHFILRNNFNAESVIEETNKRLKESDVYLEECDKRINELSEQIHHLQSTLSTMKVCLTFSRMGEKEQSIHYLINRLQIFC